MISFSRMGPALEFKVKSEASPEILVDKENMPEKVFQFGTNYNGDDAYEKEALLPIEQTPLSSGNEDVEVNITGYSNSSKALMVEDTCDDDATECSSSFGDTISGRENGSALSDDEVVSNMESSNPFSSLFDKWCEPSLLRYIPVIMLCICYFCVLYGKQENKTGSGRKEKGTVYDIFYIVVILFSFK